MDIKTFIIILVGLLALVILAIWMIKSRMRGETNPFTNMEGEEFEEYCVHILEKSGFRDVEMTPRSHDYGIDIFAKKDGITYAIQCKCYSDTVGIKAVQEAYSGKDYYDCMVGVVMTNQGFSKPAIDFAKKLNVVLWDGDYISEL